MGIPLKPVEEMWKPARLRSKAPLTRPARRTDPPEDFLSAYYMAGVLLRFKRQWKRRREPKWRSLRRPGRVAFVPYSRSKRHRQRRARTAEPPACPAPDSSRRVGGRHSGSTACSRPRGTYDREGHPHNGSAIAWEGRTRFFIDTKKFTRKSMMAYGQTAITEDLYAARDARDYPLLITAVVSKVSYVAPLSEDIDLK
jgi:hypothetical protein